MRLLDHLWIWLLSLPFLLALDALWIGRIARRYYRRELGTLLRRDIRLAPAALFYVIYLAALTVLVVAPAVEHGSVLRAAWTGGLLGLAAYGAYDLVNLATLAGFRRGMAVIDMAWGTLVTAATATWAYLAFGWFL
jgi:uncharacterized membrane protein